MMHSQRTTTFKINHN
uniref:Uncharacterized protein n=1 Tax=Arundo donax TaxID=35708 RepID=A0A0A8YHC7_ARUDO